MILVEVETVIPYPIEDVFALTVDLEKAPRWHNILTGVQQLTPHPIGPGSQWKIGYGIGHFVLEIVDYRPPHTVIFKGSALPFGTVPNFTVELEEVADGTRLHTIAHPYVPPLLRPLMSLVGPPWGRHDLRRYFREFEALLST